MLFPQGYGVNGDESGWCKSYWPLGDQGDFQQQPLLDGLYEV